MLGQSVLLCRHPEQTQHVSSKMLRLLRDYVVLPTLPPVVDDAIKVFYLPPLPAPVRPAWRFVFAASTSLLPPRTLALYGRERPPMPGSLLQVGVRLGATLARALGKPPPVLKAARSRALAHGIRL